MSLFIYDIYIYICVYIYILYIYLSVSDKKMIESITPTYKQSLKILLITSDGISENCRKLY